MLLERRTSPEPVSEYRFFRYEFSVSPGEDFAGGVQTGSVPYELLDDKASSMAHENVVVPAPSHLN
jgi:hypothetical protein